MKTRRKHRDQMLPNETDYAEMVIHSRKEFTISVHASERMNEKNVTLAQLKEVLTTGEIVEMSQNRLKSVCLLFRKESAKKTICAVVSLPSFEVVTAYKNDRDDRHDSLTPGAYEWNADVVETLNSVLGKDEDDRPQRDTAFARGDFAAVFSPDLRIV